MGQPAAKQGDRITATDMHLIQPPGTGAAGAGAAPVQRDHRRRAQLPT